MAYGKSYLGTHKQSFQNRAEYRTNEPAFSVSHSLNIKFYLFLNFSTTMSHLNDFYLFFFTK